ncbi:MAG: hypothetical protein NTU59_02540, partial [Coprothermobacterota bacterium]|nr:hypothetical protein [Coprothermobacterota bacterium]
ILLGCLCGCSIALPPATDSPILSPGTPSTAWLLPSTSTSPASPAPAPSLPPATPTVSLSPSNPSSVLLEGAGRWEQDGWTVVQIRGTPYVRGFQHGYLLAQEIEETISVHDFLIQSDTGRDFDFFAQKAEEMFLERINPEFVTDLGRPDGLIFFSCRLGYLAGPRSSDRDAKRSRLYLERYRFLHQ